MPHHWWIPVFADAPGQPPTFPPAEAPTQPQERNYGLYQQEGSDRQQWIEDANAPNCFIFPSTLTVTQLQSGYRVRSWQGNHAFGEINNLFYQVGLPVESPSATDSAYYEKCIHDMNLSWNGYIGPGVIMLDNIIRDEGAPQISDVSLAFYRAHHPVETLRHVVVGTVMNACTFPLVESLYSDIERSKYWWRSWEHGTAEYKALLGTRIGKIVCYIVLGAFPRGTRRISRIHTTFYWNLGAAHMHFEIAPIA
jgi:hypothetical protein